jgi:hypothetical protein
MTLEWCEGHKKKQTLQKGTYHQHARFHKQEERRSNPMLASKPTLVLFDIGKISEKTLNP